MGKKAPKPGFVECSECFTPVPIAGPEDRKAGVMCFACAGDQAPPMRDPRIDPQPGDVLRKYRRWKFSGSAWTYIDRQVDEVESGLVTYVGTDVCTPQITISSWRKWAATAEVVKTAGGTGDRKNG